VREDRAIGNYDCAFGSVRARGANIILNWNEER
jgi:hypothetical protein